jgi:hypothetical protein
LINKDEDNVKTNEAKTIKSAVESKRASMEDSSKVNDASSDKRGNSQPKQAKGKLIVTSSDVQKDGGSVIEESSSDDDQS